MTTTWGIRRQVVLRIKLPRASTDAWRMLWHLSRNGSHGWLRYWGQGYVCREVSSARITSQEIKYGNSNTVVHLELQQYHCRSLPHGERVILLAYQYKLYCWMKVPLPDSKFIWGKNRLSTLVCNDHGRFPVPSVLLHRGLVILSQFVTDYLSWY